MRDPMPIDRARLIAYALASTALLAPVLSWPWIWRDAIGMALGLQQMWLAAAVVLLCSAVVADSAFSLRAHPASIAICVAWIVAAMVVAVFALRIEHGGAWLLGVAFFAHSLRAAHRLWRASELRAWLSWARDMAAAFALFAWSGGLA